MADTFDVKIVATAIPALNNGFRTLFKIPTGAGGQTFLSATYTPGATSGTAWPKLLDLGTSGTVNSGTIFSFGTVVATVGLPNAGTAVTPFVDELHYVGIGEGNVGSIPVDSTFSMAFTAGK